MCLETSEVEGVAVAVVDLDEEEALAEVEVDVAAATEDTTLPWLWQYQCRLKSNPKSNLKPDLFKLRKQEGAVELAVDLDEEEVAEEAEVDVAAVVVRGTTPLQHPPKCLRRHNFVNFQSRRSVAGVKYFYRLNLVM